MINLIDELKVIPGVIGASIVSSSEGLKVANFPSIFKPERLTAVGKHLLKLYSVGRMSFDDLSDLTLNFDESVVVARELKKGTLLFAICDPTFNQNLLTMSFNLLHEEYKSGNFSDATAEIEAIPEVKESDPSIPTEQKIDASLQGLLSELKENLSKVLGPMAIFIFDEAVEEWLQQGPIDINRIDALIESVNQEISEEDKIEKYRQLISPMLKDFQKG
ncbi:MAG: roadblock/LC7 domain-containing protein [Desulfuromusa sp.]|jgi:predicted regulator of Ras-like GTPase activity (Roadblock/LC7/MglB family)|nr:roadblock/LC7 domain-containing protein [Desulfuromusa sp.]